jgi:hypothetical protein
MRHHVAAQLALAEPAVVGVSAAVPVVLGVVLVRAARQRRRRLAVAHEPVRDHAEPHEREQPWERAGLRLGDAGGGVGDPPGVPRSGAVRVADEIELQLADVLGDERGCLVVLVRVAGRRVVVDHRGARRRAAQAPVPVLWVGSGAGGKRGGGDEGVRRCVSGLRRPEG